MMTSCRLVRDAKVHRDCRQRRSDTKIDQLNNKKFHCFDDIGAAMDAMSEREYSCHSGLSRGAIQNAKTGGRLVFYTDGSINAAAFDARRVETTDPDQQRRSLGGDAAIPTGGGGGSDSCLKARAALTVYQAQERQPAIQKKKGMLVDPARAEDLVFRSARQERDGWVTWPARVATLTAAQVAEEEE
jgi:hypothetical protein